MEMETCKLELSAQINPANFLRAKAPTLSTGEASRCMFRRANMKERFQGQPGRVWQLDWNRDTEVEYFTLADLWEYYTESSMYGLAVPVRRLPDSGGTVTQHFIPYLSAIQIYTTTRTASLPVSRRSTGSETDSWSDGNEGFAGSSWDATSDHDDSSTYDDGLSAKQRGYLSFQYREWDSPHERVPLSHKVAELAQGYPCLVSLRSAELSPSSWMSVAWYPIYHIPAHGNLKGISACFLTYHSISSVFQDNIHDAPGRDGGGEIVALSPFGLVTYRMEGDLWRRPGSSDPRRLSELHWAASSWLKQVGIHHPDFTFFTSHH